MLRLFETAVNFTANPNLLREPASLEEELLWQEGYEDEVLEERIEA